MLGIRFQSIYSIQLQCLKKQLQEKQLLFFELIFFYICLQERETKACKQDGHVISRGL